MKKVMFASILALTMGMGGVGTAAQLGGVADAMKDAGQATVHAGKKAGKAVTHGTKKVVGTTGSEVREATKTKKTVKGVRCADGTVQTAKVGCAHRGGVVVR